MTSRSFLYSDGVMTDLPVPSSESPRGTSTIPARWSARCGPAAASRNYHAYIYDDGVVTNLNTLIPAGSGLHLVIRHGHQQRRPDRRRCL